MDESNSENQRSCLVDSVWNLEHGTFFQLRNLTPAIIRDAMPVEGNTKYADVNLVLQRFGYHIKNVSHDYCNVTGGVEYCVLQERKKKLLLKIVVTSNTGERFDQTPHCCAYTGYEIIDNFVKQPIIIIEDSDRDTVFSARAVFKNLYPMYRSVQIFTVHELVKTW